MHKKYLSYFVRRIQELRSSRGFTQEEVSKRIHISRSSYSKYERGVTPPSIDVVLSLAQLYSVPVYSLFMDEREMISLFIESRKDPVTSKLLCLIFGSRKTFRKTLLNYASFVKKQKRKRTGT